jgi:hypothetical protein
MPASLMEVEFRVLKEEYIAYYKIQLKENFQKKIPVVAVLLFFVIASPNAQHFDLVKTVLYLFCYVLFLSTIFYFLPFLLFNNQLKKTIAADPGYSERRKWTIQDDGLKSESISSTSVINWESFAKVQANQKYISLTLVDKRYMMVPKSSFRSDAEAVNFLGIAQTKIFQAKGLSTSRLNKSSVFYKESKPPYAIGLFGLIPLIGAIVGVALILYGIFKYKDKWLVLIGAAGICVTIAVYSFLNYANNKNLFSNGFVVIDKGKLNSLVKEIEFYKMQKGAYPDSLEQLDIKDQFVNAFDPLMSHEKNNKFNYHLIGKGYTIFSSGIDKTLNTGDDIYPTLTIDTTKMGLIIDRKY